VIIENIATGDAFICPLIERVSFRLHFLSLRGSPAVSASISWSRSSTEEPKMRARFQRRRGRDLFDLYWALTKSASPIDSVAVIESFQHHMKQEGTRTHRAEFIGILEAHLEDRGFCSDTESLLRNGVSYDPQIAGKYVIENLLRRLPE